MTDRGARPPTTVELRLTAGGAAKHPDQLIALLARALARELPESADQIVLSHDTEARCVRVAGLDRLDEDSARRVVRLARSVHHDFMTSPWY